MEIYLAMYFIMLRGTELKLGMGGRPRVMRA